MAMLQGSVAWFNNAKGFGFISNEAGPDVFVHYSEISTTGFKTLKQGESVEYELGTGPGGRPQACHVIRKAQSC